MVRRCFLDIETIPPAEESRSLIKPDLIKNLCRKGDQQKNSHEQADVSECTDEQFRSLALHAEYGRVLAIGIIMEQDGKVIHSGLLGRERSSGLFHLDEERTLRAFWRLLRDFNTGCDLIIGHNIMDFDLPFIYKRSRINQVRPSILFSFARYKSAPIFDTMREWMHWNPYAAQISLGHLADILKVGITKMDGMDGSRVYDEFLADNHKLIAQYCLQDVKVVQAIYYRMVFTECP